MWAIRLGPCDFHVCNMHQTVCGQRLSSPLHNYQQLQPLWGGFMDSCCSTVIMTLPSVCLSRIWDSSDKVTIFQSSTIHLGEHCWHEWNTTWKHGYIQNRTYLFSIRETWAKMGYGICRIFWLFLNHIKKHVRLIYVI